MAAVEEQLIQVNMKGSEGNLAFPNMLNEAFYSFSRTIEYADYGPTQPHYEVLKSLETRLDENAVRKPRPCFTPIACAMARTRRTRIPGRKNKPKMTSTPPMQPRSAARKPHT